MERRELLKLAAAFGVIGVPAIADAAPVEEHPIFATTFTDDMLFKPWAWKRKPMIGYIVEGGAIEKAAERSIDLVAEIKAASRQVSIANIETGYLTTLREIPPVAIFDMEKTPGTATFVGDVHAYFGEMIVAANPSANTVIVGPTALTILQSSTTALYRRTEDAFLPHRFGLRKVGMLDDRMDVIVDCYARDTDHTLVGFVPKNGKDRKSAMIEVMNGGELQSIMVGVRKDAMDGWRTVGLDVSKLTFI